MRTAFAVAAAVILACSWSDAGVVYWTPAHELAPQDLLPFPAAGDLDGDLDCDLSTHRSRHQHWNIGTPQSPEWELDASMFGDLPPFQLIGTYGDVDLDGDLDLALACVPDSLRFCWNVGTPAEPSWVEDPSVIAVTWGFDFTATVDFMDLDGDLDLDLAVIFWWGQVWLLENVGTVKEPEWVDNGWIAGIQMGSICPSGVFGDIDTDGDLDFVGVTAATPPQCWENVGTPQSHEFVENPAMLAGVDEPAGGGWGIELLDIDADSDLDLLLVAFEGGGLLYLNEPVVPVSTSSWGAIKAMFR